MLTRHCPSNRLLAPQENAAPPHERSAPGSRDLKTVADGEAKLIHNTMRSRFHGPIDGAPVTAAGLPVNHNEEDAHNGMDHNGMAQPEAQAFALRYPAHEEAREDRLQSA